MRRLVERYLLGCEAGGLSRQTTRNRGLYLRHFIEWLGVRGVAGIDQAGAGDIEAYGQALRAHRYRWEKAESAPWRALKSRTIGSRMRIVRQFFGWLLRERVLLVDPTAGLIAKALPRQLPARAPSESEMIRVLDALDTSTARGKRNRAIIELIYSTGLRVSECAALDIGDLDLAAGAVRVRRGKGGKGRVVPLGATAVAAVLDYLRNARPGFQRRPGAVALFLAARRCGTSGCRLTNASIRWIVRQAGTTAGLDRRINPHQLRHACATHMLRAGADIRHIQQLLGHSRIDTTEIYTEVDVSDLEGVLARSHPRHRRSR